MAGELCRKAFGDIRRVIRPATSTSITKLLIPRSNTFEGKIFLEQDYTFLQETDPSDLVWDTVIDRDKIEQYLLHYNITSFIAAAESPCGHGMIHDSLTFSGLSPSALKVLMGEVHQNGLAAMTFSRNFLPVAQFLFQFKNAAK
jgi:hypothetical protein